jgi:hypothetical protein
MHQFCSGCCQSGAGACAAALAHVLRRWRMCCGAGACAEEQDGRCVLSRPSLLKLSGLRKRARYKHPQEVGLYIPLEAAHPAAFTDPHPARVGDSAAISVLFDATRLSLRAGAAPFRSFGRISVVPRPYQFVPLIMALDGILTSRAEQARESAHEVQSAKRYAISKPEYTGTSG